jgi:hypothetical protein
MHATLVSLIAKLRETELTPGQATAISAAELALVKLQKRFFADIVNQNAAQDCADRSGPYSNPID